MPSVQYGVSAYKRTKGGLPELKLINLFVEKAATSENQVALQSRPGLASLYAAGTGPISGIFSKAGTFGGDVFSVSAANLYRSSSLIGALSGSGPVSIAGGYSEVLVTADGTLYSYNGTNLVDSGFVGINSNNVTACCFINSSFIAVEANSARYFWSSALNGRGWDVTHFETAERQPDNLLDVAPLGNNLWLFGESSVEVHADNGGSTARFDPLESAGYERGIKATGCVCAADNALFFIDSANVVNRIGEVPVRISDHGIEERISKSATAKVFSFRHDGHEFVCVRLDSETLAYDCASQEWCEFQTAQGNWAATCACMAGSEPRFGSDGGQVLGFSGWTDLSSALERRFSFAQELTAPTGVASLKLWCNAGHADVGISPQIELRMSDDAGNTFSDWEADDLGLAGDYSHVPEWRALGLFSFPGILGEGRVTDPVDFRLSAVKINDPGGGR